MWTCLCLHCLELGPWRGNQPEPHHIVLDHKFTLLWAWGLFVWNISNTVETVGDHLRTSRKTQSAAYLASPTVPTRPQRADWGCQVCCNSTAMFAWWKDLNLALSYLLLPFRSSPWSKQFPERHPGFVSERVLGQPRTRPEINATGPTDKQQSRASPDNLTCLGFFIFNSMDNHIKRTSSVPDWVDVPHHTKVTHSNPCCVHVQRQKTHTQRRCAHVLCCLWSLCWSIYDLQGLVVMLQSCDGSCQDKKD